MKEKYTEINIEYAKDVLRCAKEIFCGGIYVTSENAHPCGWDFISFYTIETIDDVIGVQEISNYIYSQHDYEDLTLLEILKKVGMKGWCFEISGVDDLV